MSSELRTLTDADIHALKEALHQDHYCRFDITAEEVGFLKDLIAMFKETRSTIIKYVIKGIFWVILAVMALAFSHKLLGKGP